MSLQAERGIKRFLICLGCLILVKLGEMWILAPRLEDPHLSTKIQVKLPKVTHPRCDACRAIAYRLDFAFREEDSRVEPLGEELLESEVNAIVKAVCTESSFRLAQLIEWNDATRLAIPPLETWQHRERPSLTGEHYNHEKEQKKSFFFQTLKSTAYCISIFVYLFLSNCQIYNQFCHSGEGIDWSKRLANHCRYIASDILKGLEVYDFWLRTGHRDPIEYAEFLCEGEGAFGDCNHHELHGLDLWPGEESVLIDKRYLNPDVIM